MNLFEAMRTTFAACEFTDDPVDDAVLHRILDNARFAPSGGNRQSWRIIVVRSPEKRARFVKWVEPTLQRYIAQVLAGEAPFNTVNDSQVDAATLAKVPPPT
jgi:nitroreductase